MIASLRRDRRGVSSLISAAMIATAGLVVSLAGATAALATPLFLLVFFFLVTVLVFFLRVVVCADAVVPAAKANNVANKHILINPFFIALQFIIKDVQRSVPQCGTDRII